MNREQIYPRIEPEVDDTPGTGLYKEQPFTRITIVLAFSPRYLLSQQMLYNREDVRYTMTYVGDIKWKLSTVNLNATIITRYDLLIYEVIGYEKWWPARLSNPTIFYYYSTFYTGTGFYIDF